MSSPPNLLSLSRFLLAAIFAFTQASAIRVVVLAAASLTDVLDGWLARRTNLTSRWGAMLDPIADRVFVLVALLVLTAEGAFQGWEALAFLSRDIMTAVGFIVARNVSWLREVPFQARAAGKVVTVMQLTTLFAAILRPSLVSPLVVLIAMASAVAIVDYTLALWRGRARREQ